MSLDGIFVQFLDTLGDYKDPGVLLERHGRETNGTDGPEIQRSCSFRFGFMWCLHMRGRSRIQTSGNRKLGVGFRENWG